ncbi:DUF1475 domain-containing protein [Halofilum ochraceum]|uniref:DUF1475 domain-containing protein n=1 Tax=Halofilum ochraceum TaxID=1611323 RepID=UPI000836D61C|nr:DUF1475 domain-containing protein [Halofilum ochraceum]
MTDARMPGRPILLVAVAAGLVLTIYLVAASIHGDLSAEGPRLLDLPWGRVLLLDVYAGIALFAGWIVWREAPAPAAAWIVALILLGNVVACIYLIRAWWRAGGDGNAFWHGQRRSLATRPPDA